MNHQLPPSPAGFTHAPVSKAVVLACGVSSIVLQASRARAGGARKQVDPSPLQLAFSGPAECLFGVFLLYYFRILERQIGSSKYAAFVSIVSVLSWLLGVTSRTVVPQLPPAAGGPYGLIFASFVQYFFAVPSLSRFTVLGWRLNDKAFIYLAGLQLCLSGGVRTLAAGLAGLVAGAVYRSNVLGMRNFKMPRFICRLGSSLGRFLEAPQQEGAQGLGVGGVPPRGAASA